MPTDSQIDDAVTDNGRGQRDSRADGHTPAREAGDGPGDSYELEIQLIAPWKQRFIEALRVVPNIDLAARKAGCSRQTCYKHKGDDALFSKLWDETLEAAWDAAEGALYEEGVVGRQKVNYGKNGEVRDVENIRDVRALDILLKGNRPAKYREKGPVVNLNLAPAQEAVSRALANGSLARFARELAERQSKIIDVVPLTTKAK